MSDSILVRITLGSYDVVHPQQKQTQVYVQIPEVARASWLLGPDFYDRLKNEPWPHVVDEAESEYMRRGVVSDSTSAAARQAVVDWLLLSEGADYDAHYDAMQAAWVTDRIRRDPISSGLHEQLIARGSEVERLRGELESEDLAYERLRISLESARRGRRQLRARVAGLEAQRDRRRLRLVALQNDALNMRGVLSPNGEPRKVPMPLGDTLTPAVEWLISRVAELEAELRIGSPWKCPACGKDNRRAVCSVCEHDRPESDEEARASSDRLTRLFAPTQALQPETPPLTIHRAQWDSIPLGLYSTPDAARAHCEDHARRDLPTAAAIDWVTDPEDGVAELHATVDGEQGPTGYTVVPLEVTSEYDEEADE